MEEVRRGDDQELCGHVSHSDGRWQALTVFGGVLGTHDDRADAVNQVLNEGLASLAERWTLRDADGGEQVVCIQEANPETITLALDYYSLPGVPTLTLTREQLSSSQWKLYR